MVTSENIIRGTRGTQWFQFKNLSACNKLVHGFTTRNGGVSDPPFSSLNMGLYTLDSQENVDENYKRILADMNVADRPVYMTNQVHSDLVKKINDVSKHPKNIIESMDGLMTSRRDVVLMTYHADCVPIIVYDPVQHVGGVVHSGWKGSAKRIVLTLISEMHSQYGSNFQDLLVGIGPSASVCCYEVGEDVIKAFEWMGDRLNDYLIPTREGHWRIDLKGINQHVLIEQGIAKSNIEISDHCTMCRTDLYFSHRTEKVKTGRMAAIFALK